MNMSSMAFSFTLSNPALGTQEQIEAKLRFYIISGSKRKRQKIRREKKMSCPLAGFGVKFCFPIFQFHIIWWLIPRRKNCNTSSSYKLPAHIPSLHHIFHAPDDLLTESITPSEDSSLIAQLVKNPPAMQKTPVRSLGPGEGIGYPLQYPWASMWLSW